jgi:ADP-ribose pyrophosphatase YjhB (NUDIX family)
MEREFPSAPLMAVGAVVVEQGRVLLVRRGAEPLKGHWSLPGGLLELGEPLIDGVMREVREETGLTVEPIELIELLDRIHRE